MCCTRFEQALKGVGQLAPWPTCLPTMRRHRMDERLAKQGSIQAHGGFAEYHMRPGACVDAGESSKRVKVRVSICAMAAYLVCCVPPTVPWRCVRKTAVVL